MDGKQARRLSLRQTRWLINFYPPFLFNRIRIVAIDPGFRRAEVRVRRSLLTRNLNGTIFGGTIFAAADPIYAVLFWQIFAHEGIPTQVWLKAATIQYLRPAASDLTLTFAIPEADLDDAREALRAQGRFIRSYRVEARDREQRVCALIDTEVYLRLPRPGQHEVSGF